MNIKLKFIGLLASERIGRITLRINNFIIGFIAGGICVDYIELRARDLKRSKKPVHESHEYIKPLKSLREKKGATK